jgi:hypothetical protein
MAQLPAREESPEAEGGDKSVGRTSCGRTGTEMACRSLIQALKTRWAADASRGADALDPRSALDERPAAYSPLNLGGPVTSAAALSHLSPARPDLPGRPPRTAAAAAQVRRTVELTTQNTENNCTEVHALIALSHAAPRHRWGTPRHQVANPLRS